VRQYFIAANKIDPENAEALQLYFSSFVASGTQPTKNAQDAVLHAYDIAPFDLGLRMTAVTVLLNRNETARARSILATVAYDPHAGSLAKFASTLLDALDKDGAAGVLALFASPPPAKDK
jgi:hypothetical protein